MDKQPSVEPSVLDQFDKSRFINQHKDLTITEHRRFLEETSIVVMYSAAAIGSSTALLFVTNLETITLLIFLVSFLYGMRTGFLMMLTTSFAFELFASMVYGFSGLMFVFKILAYLFIVLFASALHPYIKSVIEKDVNQYKLKKIILGLSFSFLGWFFTIVFDLVTSIPSYLILQNYDVFVLFFIAGIPFFIFHQLTNVILFFFVPDYLSLLQSTKIGLEVES